MPGNTAGAPESRDGAEVLLIDNYDSFVHNLARYVRELGHRARVVRNDAIDVGAIERLNPAAIIISPGPRTPLEAGVSCAVIETLGPRVPILGVCLGHQCVGAAFGARIVRAEKPMHGKTSLVAHDGRGVFHGLPSPFRATRYHSLVVSPIDLPEDLEIIARTEDGTIMALQHRRMPVAGVQFHPEAHLTEHGHAILGSFLESALRSR